jgi:hypothetical protein
MDDYEDTISFEEKIPNKEAPVVYSLPNSVGVKYFVMSRRLTWAGLELRGFLNKEYKNKNTKTENYVRIVTALINLSL